MIQVISFLIPFYTFSYINPCLCIRYCILNKGDHRVRQFTHHIYSRYRAALLTAHRSERVLHFLQNKLLTASKQVSLSYVSLLDLIHHTEQSFGAKFLKIHLFYVIQICFCLFICLFLTVLCCFVSTPSG